MFVPSLAGERSPVPDPGATGAFVGLRPGHARGHLARAVLEGVALSIAEVVRQMRGAGVPVSELRLTSGGAASSFWRGLIAAAADLPVVHAGDAEGPARGAAMLAARGTGRHGATLADLAERWVRPGPAEDPRPGGGRPSRRSGDDARRRPATRSGPSGIPSGAPPSGGHDRRKRMRREDVVPVVRRSLCIPVGGAGGPVQSAEIGRRGRLLPPRDPMSQTTTLPGSTPAQKPVPDRAPIVNECSIQVGTVNGSGSQTANNTLLRAIFQMGIPVSGKNLFPSNIAGLPTWFTIRANKHGYVARRKEIDVLVCMNADTAVEDVKAVAPGAAVVYEDTLGLDKHRSDVFFYPVPFQKIVQGVLPRREAAQARGQHGLRGRRRPPASASTWPRSRRPSRRPSRRSRRR